MELGQNFPDKLHYAVRAFQGASPGSAYSGPPEVPVIAGGIPADVYDPKHGLFE